MKRANDIDFTRTENLQNKTGDNWVVLNNGYGFIRDEHGNWHAYGSDPDDEDNDSQEKPLFQDEAKQQTFNKMRQKVRSEISKTWAKDEGTGNFVNVRGLSIKGDLRNLKSGHEKLGEDFIQEAMGLSDSEFNSLLEKKPRLAENLNKLENQPISTTRRLFSPAGDKWVREVLEDAGGDSTTDLIAAVITKFGY